MSKSIVVLLLAFVGCGYPKVARDVYLERNLAPRAAFDLSCDKKDLAYANVGETGEGMVAYDKGEVVLVPGMSNQIGVTGCGKKAVYVITPRGDWIMNSTDKKD